MLGKQTWSPFFNVPFESLFRRIVALPPKGDHHIALIRTSMNSVIEEDSEKFRELPSSWRLDRTLRLLRSNTTETIL
jgi:hypothetical protein